MKKLSLLSLLTMFSLAATAQSINANDKPTFQTSYTALIQPISASTATFGPITVAPWATVMERQIKTASQWDLIITFSAEVGLLTSTTVSSKNMVNDQTTATACVKVRTLVDGQEVAPGEVVYGKRTQTLSATLEGAIANCLSIVTNISGSQTIALDTNCVAPETISLLQDTVSANSFQFAVPNLATGVHTVTIQAEIVAMGNAQNSTFTASALLGKGTLTVDPGHVVKDNTSALP
jgi:hypothetical protein